jgi:hypothetical protein
MFYSFMRQQQVFESGYAYVYDSKQNAISYPNLKRDRVYSVAELELGAKPITAEATELSAFLTAVLTSSLTAPVISATYFRRGVPWTMTARRAGVSGMAVVLYVRSA